MYVIPLIVILVIALAIFFSPILAVILFLVFMLGLGAYKFLGPGTEPEHAPPLSEAASPAGAPGAARADSDEAKQGLWGETWPEQRSGEEPS